MENLPQKTYVVPALTDVKFYSKEDADKFINDKGYFAANAIDFGNCTMITVYCG